MNTQSLPCSVINKLPYGLVVYKTNSVNKFEICFCNKAVYDLTGSEQVAQDFDDFPEFLASLASPVIKVKNLKSKVNSLKKQNLEFYCAASSKWLNVEINFDNEGEQICISIVDVSLKKLVAGFEQNMIEILQLINSKTSMPQVVEQLQQLFKEWTEVEKVALSLVFLAAGFKQQPFNLSDFKHVVNLEVSGKSIGLLCFSSRLSPAVYRNIKRLATHLAIALDQRLTADALAQSEARLRSYIDMAPYGVFIINTKGDFIDVNPALSLISGYQKEELLSTSCYNIISAKSSKKVQNYLNANNKEQKTYTEIILKDKFSEVKWLSIYIVEIHNGFFMGVAIDVTKEKLMTREVLKAKANAELASKAKGDFLANMSHEIRTPLNGVVGFSELLMSTKLSDIQKQYMENVNVSAKTLMELINNILDISKIEAGKLELHTTQTNILDLTANVLEIVRFNAHKKGLELIANISSQMPNLVIADNLRLRQVLVNLLGNAIKFTDKGEVELSVKMKSYNNNTKSAKYLFSVRDTGVGLTANACSKLFSAFSQVDMSPERRCEGSGLGLVISNMLLEKMGTKINLNSKPGVGSDFSFEIDLPVVEVAGNKTNSILSFKRALVVDDNEKSSSVLCELLQSVGVEVDESNNGANALSLINNNAYDLLIIDYNMPNISGLDVARSIRYNSDVWLKNMPVIVLCSSSEEASVVNELDNLEFIHKIIKPVTINDLLLVLESAGSRLKKDVDLFTHHSKPEFSPLHIPGFKVLVAEDDLVNQLLIKEMLAHVFVDVKIITATNGRKAVSLYKREKPNLVFMDVNMPVKSGLEATLEIRALEKIDAKRVPIIALTAKVMDGSESECLRYGMDAYLSKPINKDKLINEVVRFLPDKNITGDSIDCNYVVNKGVNLSLSAHKNNSLTEFINSQHGMPKTYSAFNREVLMQKLGGKEATFVRLIDTAKVSIPKYLNQIKDAIIKDDFTSLSNAAHTLKGAAGTLCFENLEHLAAKMEKMKGDKKSIHAVLVVMEEEFDYIMKNIYAE
jgi:two-component system, sensor histidine kinase and response regulator